MKNFKVSAKMLTGFGITVAFILAVGLVGIFNLRHLNSNYAFAIDKHGKPLGDACDFLEAVQAMRAETRAAILFTGNAEKLRETELSLHGWFGVFEQNVTEYGKFITRDDVKALFDEAVGKYENELKPSILKITNEAKKGAPPSELTGYLVSVAKPAADTITAVLKKTVGMKVALLTEAEEDGRHHYSFASWLMTIIIVVAAAVSAFLGFYISASISKPLHATVKMITEMGNGHLDMRLNLNRGDEVGVMAKAMDTFADDLQNIVIGAMKKIASGNLSVEVKPKDRGDEIGDALEKTVKSLKAVVDTMKKISTGDLSERIVPKNKDDELSGALKETIESLRELIINDGGKVLQAAAGKDLSRRLTGEYNGEFATMKNNINTVMQNLDDALSHVTEAVAQVTSASSEISNGAQNLAEGANEQASSLEEVSSSLEEMSSMTKQNADNANRAKQLASEASAAAGNGDASMKHMATAINLIKQSSDNTAKIIKSIDDIAFQTNLLALNAAVEAARAGEAGKGFAVVAEEVRNLAMRSAEAAQNTANMIEESVKNADSGVKITEEVSKSFGQIVDRTRKVGALIAEIAAASNEQASGIEQVNIAMAQMNQVTQSNAANSEESASAAEELSAQASELANMVRAFTLSSDGDSRSTGQHARRDQLPKPTPRATARPFPSLPDRRERTGHNVAAIAGSPATAKALRAEDIIPLDGDEINAF
jgi:methyl-accepting chemotaxis protein